jgi:hypothetical protein
MYLFLVHLSSHTVLLPLTSALWTRSRFPMSMLWPLFWVLGLLTLKMEAVRYSETLIFISITYSVYAVHIVLFGPTSCVWQYKHTYGLV